MAANCTKIQKLNCSFCSKARYCSRHCEVRFCFIIVLLTPLLDFRNAGTFSGLWGEIL